MDNSQPDTVLRRKATAARQEQQSRSMSPAKALRLALAKAADRLFDLPLSVSGVLHEQLGAERLIEGIEKGRLLLLLDGPGGLVGAVCVDMQVLAGLIEMQTTGRVISAAAADRAPTRTDAALLAPLIDDCMALFDTNIEGQPDARGFGGFRYGVMVENTRMLGMALTAVDFHSFRLSVDLFDGAKSGEFMLMLPRVDPPATDKTSAKEEAVKGRSLGEAMMGFPAQIDAVLCRIKLPLSQVRELKVGDQLPLPRDVLAAIALEAGQKIRLAETRLGQLNGYRAVRLFGLNMDASAGDGFSGGGQGQSTDADQLRESAGISKKIAAPASGQKVVEAAGPISPKPSVADMACNTTDGQGEIPTPNTPEEIGNA